VKVETHWTYWTPCFRYWFSCRVFVLSPDGANVHWVWKDDFVYWSLKQINSVALSPRANYTDWATTTCRLNLLPAFVDRGVSRGQRSGSPTVVNLSFLDPATFLSSSSSFMLTRAERTSFQTHCYSENLAASGIEPGTSALAVRTLTTRPQRRSYWSLRDRNYNCRYTSNSFFLQFTTARTKFSVCIIFTGCLTTASNVALSPRVSSSQVTVATHLMNEWGLLLSPRLHRLRLFSLLSVSLWTLHSLAL
jgi:hypothetical protein